MRLRLVIFMVLAFVGCGKVKSASEQHSDPLTPPPFPAEVEAPFALTEGKQVANFEPSSLIFWDTATTPALIQAVADSSVHGRVVKSETLSFISETLLPAKQEREATHQALAVINEKIARAEAVGFGDPVLQQQTKPVADQWFETRVGELTSQGHISPDDAAQAQKMLGAYCEFKLWELATSPLLLLTYNERPSPHRMCEPYYASREYFKTAELCDPANDHDYFNCIWRDGVLKSQLMIPEMATATCPGADVYPSRRAAIEAWVANGLIRTVLADRSPFETTTYADKLTSYILGANENISSTGIPAKPGYQDFKRCRSAFRRDYALPIERWDAAAPYKLRDIAETEQIDVALTTYKLLPSSGNPDTDVANYDQLAKYLKLFGKRYTVDAAEPAASFSDYLFNHPANGLTLEHNGLQSECDILGKAGNQSCPNDDGDPAFAKFAELKRQLISADDLDSQARLQKSESDAVEREADATELYGKQQAKVNQAVLEGVTAVNAARATSYFNSFALQFLKNGDDLSVAIHFKDANSNNGMASQSYSGCIRLSDAVAPCQNPSVRTADQLDLAALSFDSQRGKLSIRIQLDAPEAVGFGSVARVTGENEISQSFNDLGADAFRGRVLQIDMFANRLGGNLDFFTGDAKLLDGDKEVQSGSVSGDTFAEAQNELSVLIAPGK